MALVRRGKFWSYDFRFEGIRYQKSTKLQDKREAEKVEKAVQTDLARRKFTLPSKSLRFSELCDRYAEVAKTNGKRAYETEKYHIAKHLLPHFGQILVHAINLEICEKYKRNQLKTGDKQSTINRELSTLKAILKYAGESGFAPEGLGRYARIFTDVETKEARVLNQEEVERIFAACASLEFRVVEPYPLPIVVVAVYTGFRPGEYKALQEADLDFDHRLISIRKSKTRAGVRSIPMKQEVYDALRLWLPRRKGPWVFPSPRNPRSHIQDFGKAFDKAVKQAGLTGVTPYSLRHTFETELDGKAKRATLAKLMGHSRARHTLPYLHPDWVDEVAAIQSLPVPANFTTLVEQWDSAPGSDDAQVGVPEELVMVGPWGLEPQTSTVSR